MSIVSFVMLSVAVVILLGATSVSAINFRHCYQIWGFMDDLGYSHGINLGRLKAHEQLVAAYGDTHNITVRADPGIFFKTPAERDATTISMIQDGCNIISGWFWINGTFATKYPNITFLFMNTPTPNEPGNFVQLATRPEYVNYELGAAAATHSQTCVAFISAWEVQQQSWSQAMGTVMGVRSINPTLPVHLVTMDGWNREEADGVAAMLLSERLGCEVILRRTDPSTTDKLMISSKTTMTVAPEVDMRIFVGDSAFSSAVADYAVYFFPIAEAALNARVVNGTGDVHGRFYPLVGGVADDGFFSTATFSPRVSANVIQAAKDAHTYVHSRGGKSNVCKPMKLRDGSDIPTATNATGDDCLDPLLAPHSYVDFDNVVYHDSFLDGGEHCTGGAYYTYGDDLVPTCVPCPVDTYRPQAQSRAFDGYCQACPEGRETRGDVGATDCQLPEDHTVTIVAVSVAGAIVFLAIAAAVVVVFVSKASARDNSCAPRNSTEQPISIIFTDIQASTRLWAMAPVVMSQAVEAHHEIIRVQIKKFQGYEVKTIGDAFMIVHADPTQAVELALAIQRALHKYDWGTTELDSIYQEIQLEAATLATCEEEEEQSRSPTARRQSVSASVKGSSCWNGIRVRIGVHTGMCSGLEDEVTKGWDYYGTPVNTAARVEATGHGGQVVITQATLDAVQQQQKTGGGSYGESTSKLFSGGAVSLTFHGEVTLRGLEDKVGLHTVAPSELSGRIFPPLRVDAHADLVEDDAGCSDGAPSTKDDDSKKSLTAGFVLEGLVERLHPAARGAPTVIDSILDRYHTLTTIFSALPVAENKKSVQRIASCWSVPIAQTRSSGMQIFARKFGANAPEVMHLAIKAHLIHSVKKDPRGAATRTELLSDDNSTTKQNM